MFLFLYTAPWNNIGDYTIPHSKLPMYTTRMEAKMTPLGIGDTFTVYTGNFPVA